MHRPEAAVHLAPRQIDYDDWRHPDVGWGVVLPETDHDAGTKHRGEDAPPAIRALLAARGGAPVLRYDPALATYGFVRRYEADGTVTEPSPGGARGVARGHMPHYLLIVGSPERIPWEIQFRLQTEAFVGRLDLDDAGLNHYVAGILRDWAGRDGNAAKRDVTRPVVWSVDHGHPDITRLMRKTIGERLANAFAADPEFVSRGLFHTDCAATAAQLVDALATRQPAFVATTSHGATFPLNDPGALARQLGALVDASHQLLDPADAIGGWDCEGAIWYAHACCSAGVARESAFNGLIDPASSLGEAISGLGIAGAMTAPLPKALLGHARPLGAFIGHVEPTFNWTLYDTRNQQTTTAHVVEALYRSLHAASRPTVGRALKDYYRRVAGLLLEHANAVRAVNRDEDDAIAHAIRAKLVASDLLGMVVLGDPTIRLPRSSS